MRNVGYKSNDLLPLVAPDARAEDWSHRLEEYANINSVENAIRAEFGMKDRYGHINQSSVQYDLLYLIAAYRLCELSDLQPQALRAVVDAPLEQAGQFLKQLKITEARSAMKATATAFVNQMDAAFPEFTQSEKIAIGTQLNQFKTHVYSTNNDVLVTAKKEIERAIELVRDANGRVLLAAPVPAPLANPGIMKRFFGGWF